MTSNAKITGFIPYIMALVIPSLSATAFAKVKVVTTIPDLAWVAAEVGGDHVETKALLRGNENAHFVDAVPEFTRLTADADVVCIAGLDLEVGYMPAVLTRSGNAKIQPGGAGYCEAGKSVQVLEKLTTAVDRSMGDVHPAGNPHFYLSPKALADGAKEIAAALTRVDPAHTIDYRKGLAAFAVKMDALDKEIVNLLKPLKSLQDKAGGKPLLIEYHREFSYFLNEYGLTSFGSIEEKPGVPPSAGRLGEIAAAAKAADVRIALAADYYPKKTLERFRELSGIELVVVPTMIQPSGSYKTYADLQRHIANSLVTAVTTRSVKI
jgi:zinc/manganese transport system substrate-binding protein